MNCPTVSKTMLNSGRAPGGHVVLPRPLTARTSEAAGRPGSHPEAALLSPLVQETIFGGSPSGLLSISTRFALVAALPPIQCGIGEKATGEVGEKVSIVLSDKLGGMGRGISIA